jgi:epoxyqueuosine reductase
VRRLTGAARVLPRRYTGSVTGEPGSPEAIARWLKEEARRQGFDRAGITTPEPPPHLDTYAAWLEAGRHGEMHYLASERARQRRADPLSLLPGCKSILVLVVNYLPLNPPQGPAQIAAYARGDDYHDFLPSRAGVIVERLQHRLGQPVAARIYSDTGPLLERELAQRAGLGWIGKNTCLISPGLGSMTLLAEVLLNLALPPDTPFAPDRCGSCQRCIDACPTHCILPDRTIDARRCISYLTIESRRAVPRELRRPVGDRLFGCDTCQLACPWNHRLACPTSDPALAPRPALDPPDLSAFLEPPAQGHATLLRGSPLKRAGRSGLARNAAVVAGNLHSGAHLPALGQALLSDPDPMVRGHAAWAVGEHHEPGARDLLRRARSQEREAGVLAEIGAALEAERGAPSG